MGRLEENRRSARVSQIAQAYRNAHEVVSAAMGLALFVGGGWWLDQRWATEPLCLLAGTLIGCLTAVVSLRRLLSRLDRESQRNKRRREQSGGDSRD